MTATGVHDRLLFFSPRRSSRPARWQAQLWVSFGFATTMTKRSEIFGCVTNSWVPNGPRDQTALTNRRSPLTRTQADRPGSRVRRVKNNKRSSELSRLQWLWRLLIGRLSPKRAAALSLFFAPSPNWRPVSRGPMIVWLTATFKAGGTNERPRMAREFE